ncbi:MAG: glycosyltransferase family 2 protein [Bacteroidales bacterium]|nr:glycosyltransferase family 2 protein [Bacteroidales bacterium]
MIKVSVIIPCYNSEATLSRCFETLLEQTLGEMEFLFVDDGSTDNTSAILQSFAAQDSRVKVFHQENSRQGGARNNGIMHASGEYVGFLDSDDLLSPNFYETLYAAAKRHSADIAWTDLVKNIFGSDIRHIQHFNEERVIDDLQKRFDTLGDAYYVMPKIYRREFLIKGELFFPVKTRYEDLPFTAKVTYAAGKMVVLPGAEYRYVYNPRSTVNSRPDAQLQYEHYNMTVQTVEFLRSRGICPPKRWKHPRRWSFYIGPLCLLKVRDMGKGFLVKLLDAIPVFYIPKATFKRFTASD